MKSLSTCIISVLIVPLFASCGGSNSSSKGWQYAIDDPAKFPSVSSLSFQGSGTSDTTPYINQPLSSRSLVLYNDMPVVSYVDQNGTAKKFKYFTIKNNTITDTSLKDRTCPASAAHDPWASNGFFITSGLYDTSVLPCDAPSANNYFLYSSANSTFAESAGPIDLATYSIIPGTSAKDILAVYTMDTSNASNIITALYSIDSSNALTKLGNDYSSMSSTGAVPFNRTKIGGTEYWATMKGTSIIILKLNASTNNWEELATDSLNSTTSTEAFKQSITMSLVSTTDELYSGFLRVSPSDDYYNMYTIKKYNNQTGLFETIFEERTRPKTYTINNNTISVETLINARIVSINNIIYSTYYSDGNLYLRKYNKDSKQWEILGEAKVNSDDEKVIPNAVSVDYDSQNKIYIAYSTEDGKIIVKMYNE
jgi:hypothetical protein